MKIIKLKKKYEEQTRKFILDVIENDFGYSYNPDWHWDIDGLFEVYCSPQNCCFIVVENDEVIGTICGRSYDKNYDELKHLKYNSNETFSIWRHYIKKDLRNQGIGKKLYSKLETFARRRGYNQIYLHTQRSIPASIQYWLKRGFDITLETDDEFQTIHMQKNLT